MFPLGVLQKRIFIDYNKIQLLLHFDNGFNDSSLYNHTLTTSGNVTISTSVPKFGTGKLLFGSTPVRDGLVKAPNLFNFGGNRPFTISFYYRDGDGNGCFFTTRDTAIYTPMELSRGAVFLVGNGTLSGWTIVAADMSISSIAYKHCAVVGDGINIKLYIDGSLIAVTSHPNWPSTNYFLQFGKNGGGNFSNGGMDEFLLYDGVLWTSNFTPPTVAFPYYAAPYWINCLFNTSTQLNDISGNNRLFVQQNGGLTVTTTNDTNGALRFNGTGWMTTVDTFDLLANNFNISCEVFIENGSDFYSVFLAQRINSFLADIEFFSLQDGRLLVNVNFDDNTGFGFVGTAIRNQWQKVEFKRVSNVFTLTVDDVIADTQTINKTVKSVSNGVLNIGNANDGSSSGTCTGSIRNLRIKIG